jgi:hypothetical protein
MSEQAYKAEQHNLDAELDDPRAISAIMELYNVDEDAAKEVWAKFVSTVRKLKKTVEDKESGMEKA